MTDYTVISNANVEPDAPFISATAFALRDNPIAIAEGAPGAPRIVNAAVTDGTLGAEKFQSGTTERDWVAGRIVDISVGGVGSHAFLIPTLSGSPSNNSVNPGDSVAGGNLRYASAESSSTSGSPSNASSAPSGAWVCLGYSRDADGSNGTQYNGATLFKRIS